MPHTKRKKKQISRLKRTEITDDDGWTMITSTNHDRSRSTPAIHPTPVAVDPGLKVDEEPYQNFSLTSEPAVPDKDMTLERLKERFDSVEKKWLASKSWKALDESLASRAVKRDWKITTAIVFGTGSPSGYRDGWIGRHEVALYQIAAFKAIVDKIEQITAHRPTSYAQEPCYNSLDKSLLSLLKINAIDHPEGFRLLSNSQDCFAYTPGAEVFLQIRTLFHSPCLLLTSGKLDFYWRNDKGEACTDRATGDEGEQKPGMATQKARNEQSCRILEAFNASHERSGDESLRNLDVKDFPFHDQYLYWRLEKEIDENIS